MSPDSADLPDPERSGLPCAASVGPSPSPWRSLRIGESYAALRRRPRGPARRRSTAVRPSRMRLEQDGAFDLEATAFLHGQGRRTIRGDAGDAPAIDGAQRVDFPRPGRDVLRRVALSIGDDDVDGQCDADGASVHAGLRGVLPARVPVRLGEFSDPSAPQGVGPGISGGAERLLAPVTNSRRGERRSKRTGARLHEAPPLFVCPPVSAKRGVRTYPAVSASIPRRPR